MPKYALSALETRILGSLLEKERVTPENYPLSLNALSAACNQATNREPVTSYDNHTIEDGVNGLREKKLADRGLRRRVACAEVPAQSPGTLQLRAEGDRGALRADAARPADAG